MTEPLQLEQPSRSFSLLYGYDSEPADGAALASYLQQTWLHADALAAAVVDDGAWHAPAPVLASRPLLYFYCNGAAVAVAKATKAGLIARSGGGAGGADGDMLRRLAALGEQPAAPATARPDCVSPSTTTDSTGAVSISSGDGDSVGFSVAGGSSRAAPLACGRPGDDAAALRHAARAALTAAAAAAPPPPLMPLSPASPPHWALLMGLEHEALGAETLERLVRRLPTRALDASRVEGVWRLAPSRAREPAAAPCNALVRVPGGSVDWLGLREEPPPAPAPLDAVDAERAQLRADARRTCRQGGARGPVRVPPFTVAARKVSNAEFLPFVEGGGYSDASLWEPRAWAAGAASAGAPLFWVRHPGGWRLRVTLCEVAMAWDWPVEVTLAEAAAWLKWRRRGGRGACRLPTEAEHATLAGPPPATPPHFEQAVHHGDVRGGRSPVASLEWRWHSPSPVDALPPAPTGAHDPAGNVWEWVADDCPSPPAHGRGGAALVGGGWATSGDPATSARYNAAEGRGALVAASFRYVVVDEDGEAGGGGDDAAARSGGDAVDAAP